MAVDGVPGAKNQPTWLATGAVEDWVDFGAAAEYAAKVGNRQVGTNAEMVALTGKDLWVSKRFGNTTDGQEYQYTGTSGGWVNADGPKLFAAPFGIVLAGTAPAAGARLLHQYGDTVQTLTSGGGGTIGFSAFPHGLISASIQSAEPGNGPVAITLTSASLFGQNFTVWSLPSGAVANGMTFRGVWSVTGW